MSATTKEAPAQAEPMTDTSTLTANDRCDQCNAQAYTWVLLEAGELLFCGHHWSKYKDKIEPKAVKIKDETHRLRGENRAKE